MRSGANQELIVGTDEAGLIFFHTILEDYLAKAKG